MIKAPFNFVPLADKVFFPDWADQVSQDLPFMDGEDGIIEIELSNCTPLFVRNGQKRGSNEVFSSHVKLEDGTKQYFIPATTIKGSIRSIMEIMSFSKMSRFNPYSFGMPRAFDTTDSTNDNYMKKVKTVQCGWLTKTKDKVTIRPCSKGVQKIKHSDIYRLFPNFDPGEDHETAEVKQESIKRGNDWFPTIAVEPETLFYKVGRDKKYVPQGAYQVVCTGHMEGKKHEYLFSIDQKEAIEVDKTVFKTFESVHSLTQYYSGHADQEGFLQAMVKQGKSIPVFFTTEGNKVTAIGITRMFRYPYPHNVERAVANCYSSPIDNHRLDLVDTIFGYTDGKQSLKGRVTFSNAFCHDDIPDDVLIPVSGVLGQPSASYFPLYLRQTARPYKTYNDYDLRIAGRKRYRIIAGQGNNVPNALPQGNDTANCSSNFSAIPYGHTFRGQIIVHNLRKAEIGALISALTFHNTPGTFINMGLAKSFGYGKLSCNIRLNGLCHDKQTYLREFEVALAREGFEIGSNMGLRQLVAIASEHDASEMQMMATPQEYEDNKSNNVFSVLSEKSKSIPALLSHSEAAEIYQSYQAERILQQQREKDRLDEIRRKKEQDQQMAEQRARVIDMITTYRETAQKYIYIQDWANALDTLTKAKDACDSINVPCEDIIQKIESCKAQQANKGGLAGLNELYPDGVRYKVTDFKGIKTRVDQWLKKNKQTQVPPTEVEHIHLAYERIKANTPENKRKDFDNHSSNMWKYLISVIGHDVDW